MFLPLEVKGFVGTDYWGGFPLKLDLVPCLEVLRVSGVRRVMGSTTAGYSWDIE